MHIVFHKDDAEALAKGFTEEEMPEERIFIIEDDFSLGYLPEEYSEQGSPDRRVWNRKLYGEGESEANPAFLTGKTISKIIQELEEDDEALAKIWIAPNARDVTGYYFLNHQLREFPGRIEVLWLNNLPFINDKGQIFYPTYLSEIEAREFIKAQKLAREITPSEFEMDIEEWDKMVSDHQMIRVLEGAKKLAQKDIEFYDEALFKLCTGEWQRASKILRDFLKNTRVAEEFAAWRLSEMAANGQIEAKGDPENLKHWDIKLPGGSVQPEEVEQENHANG